MTTVGKKGSAIRVNVGGAKYKDKKGNVWEAERNYAPGSWGGVGTAGADVLTTKDSIAGTDDPTLFQTMRSAESLTYRFDLPNGAYRVRILFAETYWESNDAEPQAVRIQGKEVLGNFNIFSEAGHDAALEKTFDARVTKGRLEIEFVGQSLPMHSGARASAIEIEPKAAQ